MIIECPECGTKNTTDKPLQPDKRYRCGKCGAVITFLQTNDTEVEERTEFNVILKDMGANKISVIRAVRELTTLGLKESKDLVESAPQTVKEGVSKDEALAMKHKMEAAGATVKLDGTPKITVEEIDGVLVTTKYPKAKSEKTTAAENTSGQGKLTVVPQEIKGWNWGAFLLGVIWGAGNNVWWSVLILIPYFDMVWIFVMGVKGSEWAWKSKRWDSIEHFKRTQKKWRDWGIGITAIVFIVFIIIALS